MKKIWKLLMLIAGLCLLGTGIWRGYYVYQSAMVIILGGTSSIVSLIIGFLVVVFMLQVFFSSMMTFFKGDNKNLKKAILASIFVIGLSVADLILVRVEICRILMLVSAGFLLVAALMFKFAKPEQAEEKPSNDNPTE
jgi:hypothetical protein